jgi:hypothetical protein
MLSRSWAVFVVAWIYLSIDLASAVIDAVTTPRMVLAFIDDEYRQALKWGGISAGAFVIPDLYIFLGTRTLPTHIIAIVLGIILLTFAVAVFSVVRKIQKGRRERQATGEDTCA